MERERRAVRAVVTGRVQGVFYRASFQQQARSRGLGGWVRNRPDGSVEFLIQGDAEAVQQQLEWAKRGPKNARVSDVDVQEISADAELAGFDIRH